MAVTSAIGDLFHSVYELFLTIFNSIYHVIHGFLFAIIHFFQDFVNLIGSVVGGVVDVAGGVGQLILGNIVLLGVVAAGVYGYLNYQRSQGRSVQPIAKKTN